MTRTVGDTSPTHGTSRFIPVDENAILNAGPAHAKLMQRLARNNNWLEAKSRRMLVFDLFVQDTELSQASRVGLPQLSAGLLAVRCEGGATGHPAPLSGLAPELLGHLYRSDQRRLREP